MRPRVPMTAPRPASRRSCRRYTTTSHPPPLRLGTACKGGVPRAHRALLGRLGFPVGTLYTERTATAPATASWGKRGGYRAAELLRELRDRAEASGFREAPGEDGVYCDRSGNRLEVATEWGEGASGAAGNVFTLRLRFSR